MAKVIYFKNVGNEHAQLNIQYQQIYILYQPIPLYKKFQTMADNQWYL